MNTIIPKQPRQVRERVEARLDARLVRRLEKYCQYLESDRDYVLAQALEIVFRKDRAFAAWLSTQDVSAADGSQGNKSRRTPERPSAGNPAASGVTGPGTTDARRT